VSSIYAIEKIIKQTHTKQKAEFLAAAKRSCQPSEALECLGTIQVSQCWQIHLGRATAQQVGLHHAPG